MKFVKSLVFLLFLGFSAASLFAGHGNTGPAQRHQDFASQQAEASGALEEDYETKKYASPVLEDAMSEEMAVLDQTQESMRAPASRQARKMSKKAYRKKLRGQLREIRKNRRKGILGLTMDVTQLVCIVIAIFIPPLGVFIWDGVNKPFWISLILTLLGLIVGGGASVLASFHLGYLLILAAIIYSILFIAGII